MIDGGYNIYKIFITDIEEYAYIFETRLINLLGTLKGGDGLLTNKQLYNTLKYKVNFRIL